MLPLPDSSDWRVTCQQPTMDTYTQSANIPDATTPSWDHLLMYSASVCHSPSAAAAPAGAAAHLYQ
jgi:hypothetical protein